MTDTIISENTTGSYIGTYTGVEDTYIHSSNATTNYGTNTRIKVTKYAAGNHVHTLIKFTGLSNIAATEVVSAVTYGHYNENSATTSKTGSIRRLLQNWVVSQATWNIYSTGNNWGTAGGISDGTDRVASASGTITLDTSATWRTCASGLETDVQNWIDGGYSNYGWHIERTDAGEDSTSTDIYSSNNASTSNRPYLLVTHAAAGATPKNRTFHGPFGSPVLTGPF